jgi:hypothetical protein
MSTILYYSNYCDKCKQLLQGISQSGLQDDMHFVCIDNRVARENGANYIVLENGQEILLPPTVTKVPALLLLNKGHHVLFGDEITKHIAPKQEALKVAATQQQGEPEAFSLMGGSGFGVASDNFSFLDQNAEALSAKGDGGMRQQHHYAPIRHQEDIDTPPDNYTADTIGSGAVEKMQQQRNQEIGQK